MYKTTQDVMTRCLDAIERLREVVDSIESRVTILEERTDNTRETK